MSMEQLFFRGCGLLVVSLGVGLGIHAANQRTEPTEPTPANPTEHRADVINSIGRVVSTVTDTMNGESRVSGPVNQAAATNADAEPTTAAEDALEELMCEAYLEQWKLAQARFEAEVASTEQPRDEAKTVAAHADDAVADATDAVVTDAVEDNAVSDAVVENDTNEQPVVVKNDAVEKIDEVVVEKNDDVETKTDEPVTVADAKVNVASDAVADAAVEPQPVANDGPVDVTEAVTVADASDEVVSETEVVSDAAAADATVASDANDASDASDKTDAPVVSDAVKDRFAAEPTDNQNDDVADAKVADAETHENDNDNVADAETDSNVETIDPAEVFVNRPVPPVPPVPPVASAKSKDQPVVMSKVERQTFEAATTSDRKAGVSRIVRGAVRGADGRVRPADEVVVIEDEREARDERIEIITRPRYRDGRYADDGPPAPHARPAHDWSGDGWQPGRGFPSHCEGRGW